MRVFVCVSLLLHMLFFYSILPTKAVDILSEFLGTNRAMDTFVGNQKSEWLYPILFIIHIYIYVYISTYDIFMHVTVTGD